MLLGGCLLSLLPAQDAGIASQGVELLEFLSAATPEAAAAALDEARQKGRLPDPRAFAKRSRLSPSRVAGGYHSLRTGKGPDPAVAEILLPPKRESRPRVLVSLLAPERGTDPEALRDLYRAVLDRGWLVLLPTPGRVLQGDPVAGALALLRLWLPCDPEQVVLMDRIDRRVAPEWRAPQRIDPSPFCAFLGLVGQDRKPVQTPPIDRWRGRQVLLAHSRHPAAATLLLGRRLELAAHREQLRFRRVATPGLDWLGRLALSAPLVDPAPPRRPRSSHRLEIDAGGGAVPGREWLRLTATPRETLRLRAHHGPEGLDLRLPLDAKGNWPGIDLYFAEEAPRLRVRVNDRVVHDGRIPAGARTEAWWRWRHELQTGRPCRSLLRLRP